MKTRSTLGLNKVYKYLFKRLVSMRVDDLQRNNDANTDPYNNDDSLVDVNSPEAEDKIEILCNGNYLKPSL